MFKIFLSLIFCIFLNPFFTLPYRKFSSFVFMTFIFVFLINYYPVELDNQSLNTFLSVSSIFLAIAVYVKDLKIIKISVLNFVFTLDYFFINILNINFSLIVYNLTFKRFFTFLITITILMFLFELLRFFEKTQEKQSEEKQ